MDATDKKIINILKKNSRTPYLAIAKEVNLTEGAIRRRVANMTIRGEITKFTIKTGQAIEAIIGIETEIKTKSKIIREKIKELGVEEIYEVTGGFDIIVKIPTNELKTTNEIVESIRAIEGVIQTKTFMVLES